MGKTTFIERAAMRLAEIAADKCFDVMKRKRLERFSRNKRIEAHLGVGPNDYSDVSFKAENLKNLVYMVAIDGMLKNGSFAEQIILDIDDIWSQYGVINDSEIVNFQVVNKTTGYKEETNLLDRGLIFAKDPETHVPFAISLCNVFFSREENQVIHFIFRNDRPDVKHSILEKFNDALSKYNPYRGKKTCIGKEVSFLPPQNVGWEDLILPQFVFDHINKYIVNFFRDKEVWKSHGVPMHRSILLSGKPGVGKTMIGKVLANTLAGVSFMWVTPEAFDRVSSVFNLARDIAPVIVFLEDLDFIAASRNGSMVSACLGEFLAELDGLKSNENIVIIGTTNNPKVLDEAISDRPGRFDRHIAIEPPDRLLRAKMLRRFFEGVDLKDGDEIIESVSRETNGFTGAHIMELVSASKIEAISNGRGSNGNRLLITREDVFEAIKNLRKVRPELGFVKTSEEPEISTTGGAR
jgi:hypothetical protein